MKKLVFKFDYISKILTGEKRSTIRLSTDLKEGDVVEVFAGCVRIGRAVIKRVCRKKLEELSEEEIKMDGFKTREDLHRALARIYGSRKINSNPYIYIIEFQLQ
ncbi:MAG: ASCH domain-containing protein [Ignisphaera sp.]|nr:ASCH domain-containing protein [Ignisphaera sp.]MCX8168410.1 ASCH domain-containing protein [Ignisphaera sp.]MDW8086097.1 ASCH domain-containing protein [Ignisphaera sp.]